MTTDTILKGTAPASGTLRKQSAIRATVANIRAAIRTNAPALSRTLSHLAILGGIVTVLTCGMGLDRTMYAAGTLSLLLMWASDTLSTPEGGEIKP